MAYKDFDKSFRVILRQELQRYLQTFQVPCVNVEVFRKYFDTENVKRGFKSLDCRGVSTVDYFKALPDVCQVDENFNLYPISARINPMVGNYKFMQRAQDPKVAPETLAAPLPDTPRRIKNLSIQDIQKILIEFTQDLSNESLHVDDYFEKFSKKHPDVFKHFSQIICSTGERIEFLMQSVSGVQNIIRYADGVLTILGKESTIPYYVKHKTMGDIFPTELSSIAVNEGMTVLTARELPLHELINVTIVSCDYERRRIHLLFIVEDENYTNFHERLECTYRNSRWVEQEIYPGMLCAVPYESSNDYHRAVVLDVSQPYLPVVFYLDRGFESAVATKCIRPLYSSFLKTPVFLCRGDIHNSPRWPQRVQLGRSLEGRKHVGLTAISFNAETDLYLLKLDTDSVVRSDISPG